jgi:large subunit ribosomal protein L24e
MKRVGEIKKRREHAFWKSRYVFFVPIVILLLIESTLRMAASREKKLAHRKKTLEAAKTSVKLVEPIDSVQMEKVREKIKVPTKATSALIPGDGRSMGMDID